MKKCNKCLQDKSENEFCKAKQYKDGLNNICRQCKKEYNADNKEANAKYGKSNVDLIVCNFSYDKRVCR